jgi:enoyl-CoA hydratase
MLTARTIAAEEAHAMGLLDRLVEPGTAVTEAIALAATLWLGMVGGCPS